MPEWRALVRQRLGTAAPAILDEDAVVEELAQHLEDRFDYLRSRGWSDAQALTVSLNELDDDRLIPALSAALGES